MRSDFATNRQRIGAARAADSSAGSAIWIVSALLILAAICVALVLTGSRIELIVAVIVALLPVIAYFSITRPLVVPYSLYVLLLPFDNVLAVSSGATLTKFIGIFSTGAILLWALARRRFSRPPVTLWIGTLFVLWMVASLLWALDLQLSLAIVPTYVGLFLLYAALSIAPVEREDFFIILGAMIAGSIAASAYGIAMFHGQSVADAQALADQGGRLVVRAGDSTIDPNAYSDAILLPFCVLLTFALRSKHALIKIGALCGLATMLGAIYVSASRGAILAIVAAIGYLIVRSRYRLQIIAGLVVPLVLVLTTPNLLVARFADLQHTGGAGRFDIWRVGLEAMRQHWLLGAGIGNYRAIYNLVFIHVYQAYWAGWDRVAHNLPLQVSAELGVVGLALVLAFWFGHMFLLRGIGPKDDFYDMRIALEAAIIGLFVAALTIDLMWSKYTWLLFATAAQLRTLALGWRPALRLRTPVTAPAVTPSRRGLRSLAPKQA